MWDKEVESKCEKSKDIAVKSDDVLLQLKVEMGGEIMKLWAPSGVSVVDLLRMRNITVVWKLEEARDWKPLLQ